MPPELDSTDAALAGVPAAVPTREPARGELVGRYVVLDRIGRGGMGVVLSAWDPELDRRIALKLLRPEHDADAGDSRLFREARAMARLAHPNVVAVHDVGVHGGRVFVAMEFVEGPTLRKWTAEHPPLETILDTFMAAGRGLAAAHAAGIVHRDFKPDNVLVGSDGRVRVLDFGIAATDTPDRAEDPGDDDETSGAAALASEDPLTRPGALIGTPAYLPPERHRGRTVDERGDQFAFCVALYEALWGRRPFAGRTLHELAFSVTQGELIAPPARSAVPRRIFRVLARGLAVEPAARWTSMQSLLDALERARRRSRAPALVLSLTAASALLWLGVRARPQPCEDADAPAVAAYDAETRSALDEAFASDPAAWVPGTWSRVDAGLDTWRSRWGATRKAACLTAASHEMSGELHDRALVCLDERLGAFRAALEVLGAPDSGARGRAVQIVEALPTPEACGRRERLLAEVSPPEDAIADRVSALDERLAVARTLTIAARHDEAATTLAAVADEVEQTGYLPLRARYFTERGRLAHGRGQSEAALEAYADAFFAAVQGRDHGLAARMAADLVAIAGVALDRHDEGRGWARHGRAILGAHGADPETIAALATSISHLHRHLGELDEAARELDRAHEALGEHPSDDQLARIVDDRGALALARGDAAGSLAHALQAHALRETVYGPEHPVTADSRVAIAIGRKRTGDLAGAEADMEAALAVYRRAFGREHPNVAGSLHNLGSIALARNDYAGAREWLEQAIDVRRRVHGSHHAATAASIALLGTVFEQEGDYQAAEARYREALEIFERTFGAEHPHVADALNNVAIITSELGDHEGALALHERALAIRESQLGPEHPDVGMSLDNLAGVLVALDRYAEAEAAARRAVAIYEHAVGPQHATVAGSLEVLAEAMRRDRPAEAVRTYERALAIREATSGPDDVDLAFSLTALGRLAHAQGDTKRAVEVLERAHRLRSEHAVAPKLRAVTDLALAQALAGSPRAVELARSARAGLRGTTPAEHALRDEIDAFLRDAPGG